MKKYEKEYQVCLSETEQNVVEYLSKKMTAYKRIHELELLRHLILQPDRIITYFMEYKNWLEKQYNLKMTDQVKESVVRNLTNEFPKEEEKKKYRDCIFIEETENGGYRITEGFQKLLQNQNFKNMVLELLDFGIEQYKENMQIYTVIQIFSYTKNIPTKMSADF